jgi:uncharacterized protein YqjF (DUF2071 family)
MKNVFLTAQWRKLIMANYAIDGSLLKPYLPKHVELDFFNGKCFVSLVGFLFDKVRLKGIPIPFHTRFPEVNLRFYVRYFDGSVWNRGVVFISEIVPLPAISLVANTLYGERYTTLPVGHTWVLHNDVQDIRYDWSKAGLAHRLGVRASTHPSAMEKGTEEYFIFEHYWGFAKKRNGKTGIYRVDHPSWKTYPVKEFDIYADFNQLYGIDFAFLNGQAPDSVFLAEGSSVKIYDGGTLY